MINHGCDDCENERYGNHYRGGTYSLSRKSEIKDEAERVGEKHGTVGSSALFTNTTKP